MAIQVQLRRGTATQNNAFTGALGELSFDTTAKQVRIHDGSTAGGFKIGVGNFPTGTNNVVLGNTALDSLDSGSPGGSNTAIGHDALTANTTASNNVAVGKDALKTNTTAASSTAVGTSALTVSTGTLNTALGKDAGSLITSGTKNTIIGSFDGNQGGLDIRTSNSHIVLSDGDGNPRLIIDDSGNVDIGGETTELKLKNTTHEDTDGGRESKITFQGEQSGGEQSVLAQIQASHDATADDQKGDLIFRTNDGADGTSPTEVFRLDSKGHAGFGGAVPNANIHAATFPASLSVGTQGVVIGNADSIQIGANFYWNGSGYKYLGSGKASRNYHNAGNVVWEIEETSGSADGAISFSEKARINEHGLCFNGDTAAANALDDYEEGTFTPSLVGLTNSPGFHNHTGKYTKIGNMVMIQYFTQLSHSPAPTFSNNAEILQVTGLPFTVSGSGYTGAQGVVNAQSFGFNGSLNSQSVTGQVSASATDSTTIIKFEVTSNTNTRGQVNNQSLVNQAAIIEVTIFYRVA